MVKNDIIQVRIEAELKKEAESLFADLGLDMASAIRIFLKQAVARDGIPFLVKRGKSLGTDWAHLGLKPF